MKTWDEQVAVDAASRERLALNTRLHQLLFGINEVLVDFAGTADGCRLLIRKMSERGWTYGYGEEGEPACASFRRHGREVREPAGESEGWIVIARAAVRALEVGP